jgi:hypothetical protein
VPDIRKIPINEITINPLLGRNGYSWSNNKLSAMADSYALTGPDINIVGREGEDGRIEIAHGHYNYKHLLDSGAKEIEIQIEELSDDQMIKKYAFRNLDAWKPNTAQINMAVDGARKRLRELLNKFDSFGALLKYLENSTDEASYKNIRSLFDNEHGFKTAKGKNVGIPLVEKYFEGLMKYWEIQYAFEILYDDTIERQAAEKFDRIVHAKAFRDGINDANKVGYVYPVGEQTKLADEILDKFQDTRMTKQGIKEFIRLKATLKKTGKRQGQGKGVGLDELPIDREALLARLKTLKRSVGRSAIDQFSHFLFMDDKIVVYGGDAAITTYFSTGITGSVAAKGFYKWLVGLEDPWIGLDLEWSGVDERGKWSGEKGSWEGANSERYLSKDDSPDYNWLFIMTPDRHDPFPAYSEFFADHPYITLPKRIKEDGLDDLNWQPLSSQIKEGLLSCKLAASRDMTEKELVGVLVDGNRILASDGLGTSMLQLDLESEESFLLKAEGLKLLTIGNFDTYCLDRDWVHFSDGTYAVSIRRLDQSKYPVEKALDGWDDNIDRGTVFRFPRKLASTIEKLQVFFPSHEKADFAVEIKVERDQITCFALNRRHGGASPTIQVPELDVGEFSFEVYPEMLKGFLGKYEAAITEDRKNLMFILENHRHIIPIQNYQG